MSDAGAIAIGQAISKNTFLKQLLLSEVMSTINFKRIKLEILVQWDLQKALKKIKIWKSIVMHNYIEY